MKDPLRVTFLGPAASFSHQAALGSFGSDSAAITLFPSISFADAFSAIQEKTADFAVIPFENSTNGSVVQTLDLLADRQGLHKDITVCGEYFLTVEHCLIIRRPSLLSPTTTTLTATTQSDHNNEEIFKSITKLYTHPQAWGQCEKFLGRYFKGIERQDVSSTSKAVEIVSKNDNNNEAAIASSLAAEYHGAFVLQRHIEDSADNTTRFLILRNETSERSLDVTSLLEATTKTTMTKDRKNKKKKKKKKTLISFIVEHSAPGALADALSVFKRHSLNLTSINSRPSLVRPWQYIFFVECEHAPADDEACTSDILRELGTMCLSCRDLGTWVDGRDLVT